MGKPGKPSKPSKPVDEATRARYEAARDVVQSDYIDQEFKYDEEDFEILSSIRYDPLIAGDVEDVTAFEQNEVDSKMFFLLEEHVRRINLELNYFKFGYSVTRKQLLDQLNVALRDLDKSKPYKLRLTIDKRGVMKIDVSETPIRHNLLDGFKNLENYTSQVWNVFLDEKPILISPFTSFKTTRRKWYNEARERMLIKEFSEPQEVLLYNTAQHITEGTITNVAIKMFDPEMSREFWYTPVLASGCLCGVVRHMLLAKGMIQEKNITLKDIKIGDEVLLFNGIMGVVRGRIMDREMLKHYHDAFEPFLDP